MRQFWLIFIFCCLLCLEVSYSTGTTTPTPKPTPSPAPTTSTDNPTTKVNGSQTGHTLSSKPHPNPLRDYKSMTSRILYVVIAVSAVVGVYFIIRTIRIRRGRRKAKKYGVVTSAQGDMELQPLEEDDDEDDMTVFDRSMTNHN